MKRGKCSYPYICISFVCIIGFLTACATKRGSYSNKHILVMDITDLYLPPQYPGDNFEAVILGVTNALF
jgi:hypothetical protein